MDGFNGSVVSLAGWLAGWLECVDDEEEEKREGVVVFGMGRRYLYP